MAEHPYRRRRYLVNRGLQLRYMAITVACMLTASVFVGATLYVGIWGAVIPEFSEARMAEKLATAARMRDYDEVRRRLPESPTLGIFREAKLLSAHEQDVVAGILDAVNRRLALPLMLLVLLLGGATIVVSHRVAGPLYRLAQSARALGQGDLTVTFNLRRSDELHEVGDALNAMVTSVRTLLSREAEALRTLTGGLDRLARASGSGMESQQIIAELRTHVAQRERALAAFTLRR